MSRLGCNRALRWAAVPIGDLTALLLLGRVAAWTCRMEMLGEVVTLGVIQNPC